MQLFRVNRKKEIGKVLLATMAVMSFTSVCSFSSAEDMVQTVYAAEGVEYSASSNAIEMKLTNKSVVDTSAIKEGNFKVFVNNVPVELTDKILVLNGSSFLPLRAIGDAIGATTSWDATNKMAKIEFRNYAGVTTTIEMTSDCTKMLVNGITQVNVSNQNPNTATFIDPSTSRIYLPVRAISENLEGVKIEYFANTRVISITTNSLTPTDPTADQPAENPDVEKPGEGGNWGKQPEVVTPEGGEYNGGEKKPDYAGSKDLEKSPGGNWIWNAPANDWMCYAAGGSFVWDSTTHSVKEIN